MYRTPNVELLTVEAREILAFFDDYSTSDPYGWDWPTMRMIFPEKCQRYEQLRAEYRKIIANSGELP